MLFSSLEFLCGFLPLTIVLYFLCPIRWRNLLLLIVSLLFYAPHTTAQALKTAHLAAYIFGERGLGFDVEPAWDEPRYDIIQSVIMGSAEGLCAFCRGIQAGSPVDSYVTPEPWDMPGYTDQVIMAAGAFTQGSSIELSADGPLRAPYTAFMQGGLTYESGKIGILSAAEEVVRSGVKPIR